METVKTIVLTEEQTKQLATLCKQYREEQNKESVHKKNKESIGKTIKSFLGDSFDGGLTIETDEYSGTITYKYIISFTADKEKIQSLGLYDDLYKPQQCHKLTIS